MTREAEQYLVIGAGTAAGITAAVLAPWWQSQPWGAAGLSLGAALFAAGIVSGGFVVREWIDVVVLDRESQAHKEALAHGAHLRLVDEIPFDGEWNPDDGYYRTGYDPTRAELRDSERFWREVKSWE